MDIKLLQENGAIFENVIFENNKFVVAEEGEFYIKLPLNLLLPREALELDVKHYIYEEFIENSQLRDVFDKYIDFMMRKTDKWFEFSKNLYELPPKIKNILSHFNIVTIKKELLHIKSDIVDKDIVKINNKEYVLPFMEYFFVSPNANNKINILEDSIEIKGTAKKDIYIYKKLDTFGFIDKYKTFVKTNVLYSQTMGVKIDGKNIKIRRKFDEYIKYDNIDLPKIIQKDDEYIFSFIMLGNKLRPKISFWSLKKLLNDNKLNKLIYTNSLIRSNNMTNLVHLLEELNKLEENNTIKMLKNATLYYLELIGANIDDDEFDINKKD